eukprot:TRINITY_DN10397_c0_g2_i1.p1 TRINITY_DN10397_c0_g2~~TRINITY_DN10397_c0_g2_i1.p1  ORF type:complete len:195 (-),score=24.38 TRINITY_DN10397_c0_g2_i1:817-1401(-)
MTLAMLLFAALPRALDGRAAPNLRHGSRGATAGAREADRDRRLEQLEKQVTALTAMLEDRDRHAEDALDDDRVLARYSGDGSSRPLNMAERLRYLERKVAGSSNWLSDPQLWRKQQYECKNVTDMGSKGEHAVCLDGWEERHRHRLATSAKGQNDPSCVVYDLGIRAQPEFGKTMMEKYGCSVRAYDPSRVSAD